MQQKINLKKEIHKIIFENRTKAGKVFDVLLIIAILLSTLLVLLDSIPSFHQKHGDPLILFEWVFTVLFTIEYGARIYSANRPWKYVFSLLGFIDLVSILPMYISTFVPGAQSLLVVRILRIMRIFRIFRLRHFLSEMNFLQQAIKHSTRKISIFLLSVISIVVILGSLLYLVENGAENAHGFNSIPDSIYWAIVTITTVGYGDIVPVTFGGKFIASCIMLMGYGILAVPTGIFTLEMAMAVKDQDRKNKPCSDCGKKSHDKEAEYCSRCGTKL